MNSSADASRTNHGLAACGTVSGILISNLERFLRQAHIWLQQGERPITNDKFVQFLLEAERFANECSFQLAQAIREHSNQPEVQASSEAVLNRLVRNRCFEQLDQVLEIYLEVLDKLQADLERACSALADSPVKDAALRLVQSHDGTSPTKRYRLPVSGRPAAFLKVLESLDALQMLPDITLDYCVSKMLGHQQADHAMQQSFVRKIHDSTEALRSSAIALISNFDAVKRHRWEQTTAAESAMIGSVAMLASLSDRKRKSGFGRLALALLCSAPLAYVASSQQVNLYLGAAAGACMIVALFFYYRALMAFTKTS